VLGSVTGPGRLHRAVTGAADRLNDGTAHPRVIDLADARIAFADGRPPEQLDDETAQVVASIAHADAVVLATPVYRGSLTGALKNVLDHVPVDALESKPTGIIAMGATDHHFLGAERHLRDILAFFGALVAPTAVYLTSRDFEDGEPTADAGRAVDGLLRTVLGLAESVEGVTFGPAPLAARR